MGMSRAEVWISGRVQGVGFREWTRRTARANGLVGFVQNLPDGRVHLVVEGESLAVERMLELLHCGPPLARVEKVEVERSESVSEFLDFSVRRGSSSCS